MSILLESLNQSKKSPNNEIPSLDDSHFDDDMLGDEWLLRKVMFWKVVSGLLLIALMASWILFYYFPKAVIELPEVHSDTGNQDKLVRSQPQPEKKIVVDAIEIERPMYQPKKIEKPVIDNTEETGEPVRIVKSIDSNDLGKSNKVVEFESLPEPILREMPELEISSYAVSNNVKKSFVVLNGAFYGVGETIAPHLVLMSINKEGIVIKFKDQLISKKYSL